MDGAGETTATFDGYTTWTPRVAAALSRATVTLSVANLLDADYITYFSQAASTRDDQFFAGRGRTLSLRLATRL